MVVESLEMIKRDLCAPNVMQGQNPSLAPAGDQSLALVRVQGLVILKTLGLALATMVKSPLKTMLEIPKTSIQTHSRLATCQDLTPAEDQDLEATW